MRQTNKRHQYAAEVEFATDIWMEVLCKASSSVLRCMRVVSTEFEAMTYTPQVLDAYRESHFIVLGYVIRDGSFNPPAQINFVRLSGSRDLPFNIDSFWETVVATTEQGLMYTETFAPTTFEFRSIIRKHATGEFRQFPSPTPIDDTAIMSLVVLRLDPIHYKLIRLSKPKEWIGGENNGFFPMEVFDSNDWGWEKHTQLQLPIGTDIIQPEAVVCGCGVYLLLLNKKVLKINAISGLCTTIFTPSIADEHEDHLRKRIVKIDGRVMFWYQQRNDKWDSWMLGRTDSKWTSSAVGQVYPGRENWWDFKDGLISFYSGGTKTHSYRPEVLRYVFPFETDFELANL